MQFLALKWDTIVHSVLLACLCNLLKMHDLKPYLTVVKINFCLSQFSLIG